MNFIWFLLSIILFYMLYWYVLSYIIFLPSYPIMGFITYLIENNKKKWTKIVLIPTFILAFILGTFLPCAIFGAGFLIIAIIFLIITFLKEKFIKLFGGKL